MYSKSNEELLAIANDAATAQNATLVSMYNRPNSGDVEADLIADKDDMRNALDAAQREIRALRAMIRKAGLGR